MKSEIGSFYYRGRIPASKSILNRLLILNSFESGLHIDGESHADDVSKMKAALGHLMRGEVADCGAAGTTLRFLALRASRIAGNHNLSGSLRLFARPQGEIDRILSQLGCQIQFGPQRVTIRGNGWVIPPGGIRIERSISSQFASALILSAWDLPSALRIYFDGSAVSLGYLQMTLDLVRQAGMEWFVDSDGALVLPAGARVKPGVFVVEPDLSSAFAVAGLAAVDGRAEFLYWPTPSLQPDAVFASILNDMGCAVSSSDGILTVVGGTALRPVEVALKDAPDLFPVLAVLCALAGGRSRLRGAPHLIHKESNRVEKTAELVKAMGRKVIVSADGMEILGSVTTRAQNAMTRAFDYDSDHDHRLAMAAAVARRAGFPVRILKPDVVNKSFPEFWSIVEGVPR